MTETVKADLADEPARPPAEPQGRSFAGTDWLSHTPGSIWILDGTEVVIERISALDRVVVRQLSTELVVDVERTALMPAPVRKISNESKRQIEEADAAEVEEAKRKEQALAPYADGTPLKADERHLLAAEFQVDVSTIKRWLKLYRSFRHWSVFLDEKPGAPAGVWKLHSAVEAIIAAAVNDQAVVDQDFTAETILPTIEDRCHAARLPAPSIKSVRKRVRIHRNELKNLPSDIREDLKRQFRLNRGKLEVDGVLDMVQVDHTPVDVPVNCPITARPLGCPVITIVFDVKTRVVLGFCLTLEAPSQLSTALALHHAVFPKEEWLARIGANGPWPFYGIMRVLHTDRAGEFVTPHFERAAMRWNIETRLRRGGQPQHGGHIERFLGTLMKRIHGQKGASRFRGRKRRQELKSHHTLASMHTWIANEITAYHHERHRSLGMTPAQAWEEAWMSQDGLRLPVYPRDEREFLISFLPGASRVVSREGILWRSLQYRCPDLEAFIAPAKRQFFRFDKRDISRIYFDTGEGAFLEVQWTQFSYPPLSLWEWDELRSQLRRGARQVDARIVHEAREANRELNRRLQGRSQRARRRLAREREWQEALPASHEINASPPLATSLTSLNSPLTFEVLE